MWTVINFMFTFFFSLDYNFPSFQWLNTLKPRTGKFILISFIVNTIAWKIWIKSWRTPAIHTSEIVKIHLIRRRSRFCIFWPALEDLVGNGCRWVLRRWILMIVPSLNTNLFFSFEREVHNHTTHTVVDLQVAIIINNRLPIKTHAKLNHITATVLCFKAWYVTQWLQTLLVRRMLKARERRKTNSKF